MPHLGRRLAPVLAQVLLVAAVGCRDGAESPTAPESADPAPALVAASTAALSLRQVGASFDLSCGVTTNNRAYCWGWNGYGQLGDGTTTDSPVPVAVVGAM